MTPIAIDERHVRPRSLRSRPRGRGRGWSGRRRVVRRERDPHCRQRTSSRDDGRPARRGSRPARRTRSRRRTTPQSNVFTISSPSRAQPGSAASAAVISASARGGIASIQPERPRRGTLGACPASPTSPKPRRRSRSSSTATSGLTLHVARRHHRPVRPRGAPPQLPVRRVPRPARAGPRRVADARCARAARAPSRRRARRRVGHADPLERRPRDRHLRLEHAPRLATTRPNASERATASSRAIRR